jgi:hypothetical protein
VKPRLFIGSSSESLSLVYAVHENLKRDAECTPWSEGIFEPNKYTLESLSEALVKSDFGIFVFAADDVLKMRGGEYGAVRDNVLFELGMFIGSLGRERAFFLLPDNQPNFRLPSDLLGLTPLTYESERQDENWTAAVGPAAHQLRQVMKRLGKKANSSAAPAAPHVPIEEEVRAALTIHTFAGPDRELQLDRIELATSIATIAAHGISAADAETIWSLGVNKHNASLRHESRPDLAPLHIEEADALNRFLSARILSAPVSDGKTNAIQYLGTIHHNMVSMISHRAQLAKKDR